LDSGALYKTIEHTADIGVEVEAPDKAGIFTRSALAMFDLMFGLESIDKKEKHRISAKGENLNELLVAWLNEVLYVHAVERFVFSGFADPDLSGDSFSAWGLGERFDPATHKGEMEIKAATYHEVSFKQTDGMWRARIIFDV
jgi:SHS2 domain-containing protein